MLLIICVGTFLSRHVPQERAVLSTSQAPRTGRIGLTGDCPWCTEELACGFCTRQASLNAPYVAANDLEVQPLDPPQETWDTLIVNADNTGYDHIKVSTAGMSSGHTAPADIAPPVDEFEAALKASARARAAELAETAEAERQLNRALQLVEPGAELNRGTPADGHCLFHALRCGGLASIHDIPCDLTIAELRQIALSTATPEELAVAAAGSAGGVSVDQYVAGMCSHT